jgi:multiphosphoryl transfer protein
MKKLEIVIQNPTGLHARPAKEFVNIAKKFQSKISVFHGEKKANAKSLISMLTLGVESGSEICVEVSGDDEETAIIALEHAILDGLGEGELTKKVSREAKAAREEENNKKEIKPKPQEVKLDDNLIQGIPGAPGIAIGPIYRFQRTEIVVDETFSNASQEKEQLKIAIEASKQQLKNLYAQMLERDAEKEAAIFEVHLELIEDDELLKSVMERINQGKSAGAAWKTSIDDQASTVACLDDPLLAARAGDLQDVGYRVLCNLIGVEDNSAKMINEPMIVIAEDLSPSDTASFDQEKVLGFCTAKGGPTSHTAIIARALNLPAIVGVGDAVLTIPAKSNVILNGQTGVLTTNPNEADILNAQKEQQEWIDLRIQAQKAAGDPAITTDGHSIEIAANIGGVEDALKAFEFGAEAVGLLRTEFLFINRTDAPSEAEQFQVYQDIAQAMHDLPVVVRTLDIGGDKPLPYVEMIAEDNPFLGERGIRICLARPELLRQQLHAILRASEFGDLRIMFPMVSDINEWREARQMVSDICAELGVLDVETGIMIEVPSAALMADVFAKEVDFFSIGTNDLSQYTLAIDRMHPNLAGKSDGLHPAILRLIDRTVKAAHQEKKWVGVCGELGADPQAVPILIGLGVDELSVNVPAVPTVKAQVRQLNHVETKSLAQKALGCATAQEVRSLVG